MTFKTIVTTLLFALCLGAHAQGREPSLSVQASEFSIFDLPPFERAVCCIKFYEGLHREKDYPYVGYGHRLKPGEHYSSNMSQPEAELLLRKDLSSLCAMFQSYGKDSLLLAALAYNVGPYQILGCKGLYEKSLLLRKLEAGIRDIKQDYIQYCHWNDQRIASIERRRYAELILLYTP